MKEEKKPKDDSPRPRPLHKTYSLFMRSIAPTISKAEIIAVSCSLMLLTFRIWLRQPQSFRLNICIFFFSALQTIPWFSSRLLVWPSSRPQVCFKKSPNFKYYEAKDYTVTFKWTLWCNRFFRRCWVTFDRSVNIKEVCWNLQNIRVSMTALGIDTVYL